MVTEVLRRSRGGKCSAGRLCFARDAEGNLKEQQGLRHKYQLVCDHDDCDFAMDMENLRTMRTGRQGRPSTEVNSAAVAASEMSGTRQKSIDLMIVAMGILGVHNRRAYRLESETQSP